MNLFVVLMLFFSTAYSLDFNQCIREGDLLGDGKRNDKVSEICLKSLFNSDNVKFVSSDTSDLFDVRGYKNLLVHKNLKANKIQYISGVSSRLKNIGPLDFNESTMKTLVYDIDTKYLLTFDVLRHGNIAPIYRFELKDIRGEVNQVIQLPGVDLNALLIDHSRIVFFNIEATEFAHKEKNNINIRCSIVDKTDSFGEILSIDYDHKNLYLILNTKKGKFELELSKLPDIDIRACPHLSSI